MPTILPSTRSLAVRAALLFVAAACTLFVQAIPATAQPAAEGAKKAVTRVEIPAELPAHPRLFLNNHEIAKLKAFIEREPWLKEFVGNFLDRSRKQLSELPMPNDKGHNNRGVATRAHELAIAYVLTDEKPFAEAAAKILTAYIPLYKNYPVTRTKGKAMSSTLDETRWAVDYASAYDLVYSAGVLSEEQKQGIERDVLKPCGEVLRICNHRYRSNWRARALAGAGLVGFCINDRDLIEESIHGYRDESGRVVRDGLLHHISMAVLADGIFYERSYGYQSFTADSYCILMEAARHSGVDLWHVAVPAHPLGAGADVERAFGPTGAKTIKPMFDALFYRTFSDGTVPVVANAGNDDFVGWRYYEACWREYKDPKFAFAARIPGGTKRPWADPKLAEKTRLRSPTELVWMVPDLPEGHFSLADDAKIGNTGVHKNACSLMPSGGYAMLRQSADPDAVGVGMTFGRWGSGHSHADKLSIVVSNGQDKLIREVKGFGYGDREYLTWDRQTIAHNTVTVDETSQAPQGDGDNEWAIPAPGEIVRGRPMLFHPGERMKVFRAEMVDGNPGVRLERTLVLVDSVLVDFFRCLSDERHTYDYALHIEGEFPDPTEAEAGTFSDAYGYKHITELRRSEAPEVVSFRPNGHIRMLHRADVTTGRGIKLKKKGKQRPVLIARQEGANVDFVTVISFGDDPVEAKRLPSENRNVQIVELPGGIRVQNTPTGVVLIDADGKTLEQADQNNE